MKIKKYKYKAERYVQAPRNSKLISAKEDPVGSGKFTLIFEQTIVVKDLTKEKNGFSCVITR